MKDTGSFSICVCPQPCPKLCRARAHAETHPRTWNPDSPGPCGPPAASAGSCRVWGPGRGCPQQPRFWEGLRGGGFARPSGAGAGAGRRGRGWEPGRSGRCQPAWGSAGHLSVSTPESPHRQCRRRGSAARAQDAPRARAPAWSAAGGTPSPSRPPWTLGRRPPRPRGQRPHFPEARAPSVGGAGREEGGGSVLRFLVGRDAHPEATPGEHPPPARSGVCSRAESVGSCGGFLSPHGSSLRRFSVSGGARAEAGAPWGSHSGEAALVGREEAGWTPGPRAWGAEQGGRQT